MQNFNVRTLFFFLILFGITTAFIKLISPFLIDIVVAIALATLFLPVFRRLSEKTGRAWLASLITVILISVILVVPLALVGTVVTGELADFIGLAKSRVAELPDLTEKVINLPILSEFRPELEQIDIRRRISELVNAAGKFFLNMVQNAFVNVYRMLFNYFIVVVVLYFLFIDGSRLVNTAKTLVPFKYSDEDLLFSRFKSIIDATLKGTIIIAVMEGTVGGLLLAVLGFPSPPIWAVIMVILSVIPIVGTNLVLVPAVVFELATGRIVSGLIILVVGVGFVSISQNFIKPKLVGEKSGLHPAVVLLATLGGIAWLGLIGFIIGPVIAAMFASIWAIFGTRYRKTLEEN